MEKFRIILQCVAIALVGVGAMEWAEGATWQCKPSTITAQCPTQHTCDDLLPCDPTQVSIPGQPGTFTVCLCSNTPATCIMAARRLPGPVIQIACYNNGCHNPAPCGAYIGMGVCPACP